MTAPVLRLHTADPDFDTQLQNRLHWSDTQNTDIENSVDAILHAVRERGDAAVLEYAHRFDGAQAETVAGLRFAPQTLRQAYDSLPDVQRNALDFAAQRIRSYHEAQRKATGTGWQYTDEYGNTLGQKITPLDRVGIYVPGGKAAYPSSVLMNAIPAHVAGVEEIIMVVPCPAQTGEPVQPNPLVLAAAHVAGVTQAYNLGGAHAVAALAYGTQSIAAVDKITGPGNAYVAAAKRKVFGTVGIDMIAGPSEILVLADGSTPPDWVAMDLFSQAEHDELAQSILLCPHADYLDAVQHSIDRLLPDMPRKAIIAESLKNRGLMVQTESLEQACDISNRIAPEHLEICCDNPQQWEPLLKHAGAIFIGSFTSESLGDYCAGPNHVLPTSQTARFSSPLGVYDFQKRSSLIRVSEEGAQVLGKVAYTLASGEQLTAHAEAARLRLRQQ